VLVLCPLTRAGAVLCCVRPSAVPGRRLWLLSAHNFASTYYAPLLFRPLSFLRGLRNLFGGSAAEELCRVVALDHGPWASMQLQ
jgi:hypothetical protein